MNTSLKGRSGSGHDSQTSMPLITSCVLQLDSWSQCSVLGRKEVWAQLRSEALVALKRDLYAPMTAAEARLTLESRQLGVSRLRLIPKSKGTLVGSHVPVLTAAAAAAARHCDLGHCFKSFDTALKYRFD